jgi:hypothetical protein
MYSLWVKRSSTLREPCVRRRPGDSVASSSTSHWPRVLPVLIKVDFFGLCRESFPVPVFENTGAECSLVVIGRTGCFVSSMEGCSISSVGIEHECARIKALRSGSISLSRTSFSSLSTASGLPKPPSTNIWRRSAGALKHSVNHLAQARLSRCSGCTATAQGIPEFAHPTLTTRARLSFGAAPGASAFLHLHPVPVFEPLSY